MWRADLRRGVLVAVLVALAIPASAQDAASKRQKEIADLVAQLGADDYHARQRAQDKLAEMGAEAFDALAAAQSDKDTEIASRARFLLRTIRVEVLKETDNADAKEILKDYVVSNEADRLTKIGLLARLPGQGGLDALCRLVRFEQSEVLSKHAAVQVLSQTLPSSVDWKGRSEVLSAALGSSQRAGAKWLRSYTDAHLGKTEAAAKAWGIYTEEEAATLRTSPQQTHTDVVIALLRYRVGLLDELKRRDEAQAAIRHLVELHPATTEKLLELLDWVRKHKAWTALGEIEKHFRQVIEKEPILLYSLASAREAEGQPKVAAELAATAQGLNPGEQFAHWRTGRLLQSRGMFKWAEQEYRHAMSMAPTDKNSFGAVAGHHLSEMLHDQGAEENELKAAKALEETLAAMEKNIAAGRPELNRGYEVKSSKARMHYFHAMHFERKDPAKHVELLDKAMEADATDADALIALYRLPKQDETRKAKTLKLIEAAANTFREQIRSSPDSATPYNQFAWLIGNTEGDYEEALRYSHKSLELSVGTAAYLDTLGRCYYARRDYANAVKHQRMAVEQEPHSGQMQRQLELFEKAAAEAAGAKKE